MWLIAGSLLLLVGCGGDIPFGPEEGNDPTGPGSPGGESPPSTSVLVLGPSESCSGHDPDLTYVSFEDDNLEDAVKQALGSAPFTCRAVSGLTLLSDNLSDTCQCDRVRIESLVGIQNLTGLTDLDLGFNSITDISLLSGLTELTDLNLVGNWISDIGALSGLTGLTDLNLEGNIFTDLDYGFTSITDINALSGLTELTDLNIGGNQISDISPLSGLTELRFVDLYYTRISDIIVLFEHPNLIWVDLRSTDVSCEDIDRLRDGGVTVSFRCPVAAITSQVGISQPQGPGSPRPLETLLLHRHQSAEWART